MLSHLACISLNLPYLVTVHKIVKVMTLVVVLFTLVQQFLHSLMFWKQVDVYLQHEQDSIFDHEYYRVPHGFGACLMIKEDLSLLNEWIAYHYTMLPLRYLIVGSDVGNQEDPTSVLQRWNNTIVELKVELVHIQDLLQANATTGKQANIPTSTNMSFDEAHHALIDRQKTFLSYCTNTLKEKYGVSWTIYSDSDEYIVPNRFGNDDTAKDKETYKRTRGDAITDASENDTVWDMLQRIKHQLNHSACITLPRLTVGALENKTCDNAATTVQRAKSMSLYNSLDTLRFVQHAVKGDFAASKYGKVMMDLSQIPYNITKQGKSALKNIHRPYKEFCGPGAVYFASAPFYLNHYIGSWERYRQRVDARRNRGTWEERAYIDHGMSCDKMVHSWFDRFVNAVGEKTAMALLE